MECVKLNECDTKQLLKQILKRPGMYVGKERLDYINIFLMGWMSGKYEKDRWHSNYDFQEWLFRNHSIAISYDISMNGWSVFYAYFGVGRKAIDHFAEFVEGCPFTACEENKKMIAQLIYDIYGYHEYEKQIIDGFSKEEIDCLKVPCNIELACREVIRLINEMISEQYEKLYVYIFMDGAIQQIRFMYYTAEGHWIDNIRLLSEKGYIKQHIILHGYITMLHSSLFEDEGNKEIIMKLKVIQNKIEIDKQEKDYNNWVERYQDSEPVFEEYLAKWKDNILNSYINIELEEI